MVDVEEKQMGLAIGILEDCRRQIAAYKGQRWDVVKWGVTVNLALAVAAAASGSDEARLFLLLLSCAVALGGWILVRHYNSRMTGARQQAVGVIEWLRQKSIDYDSITGESSNAGYAGGENYDRQELKIFAWILGASTLLVLISLFVGSKS